MVKKKRKNVKRNIDTSTIEEMSISFLKDICHRSLLIKPEIHENDKILIWDGKLYLYNKSPFSQKTLVGRAPVQVKGTTNDRNKFNISNETLNHYYNEGGAILILIISTRKNSTIRYFYLMILGL